MILKWLSSHTHRLKVCNSGEKWMHSAIHHRKPLADTAHSLCRGGQAKDSFHYAGLEIVITSNFQQIAKILSVIVKYYD